MIDPKTASYALPHDDRSDEEYSDRSDDFQSGHYHPTEDPVPRMKDKFGGAIFPFQRAKTDPDYSLPDVPFPILR